MEGFDIPLIEFVNGNVVTIGLVLYILKGLAKLSPWAWDDSVVSLFAGAFNQLNPTKKGASNEKNLPAVKPGPDAGV
jgi:hypothetical protein